MTFLEPVRHVLLPCVCSYLSRVSAEELASLVSEVQLLVPEATVAASMPNQLEITLPAGAASHDLPSVSSRLAAHRVVTWVHFEDS